MKAEGTGGEGEDDFMDNFSECSKRWVFNDPWIHGCFFLWLLTDSSFLLLYDSNLSSK